MAAAPTIHRASVAGTNIWISYPFFFDIHSMHLIFLLQIVVDYAIRTTTFGFFNRFLVKNRDGTVEKLFVGVPPASTDLAEARHIKAGL